MYRPTAFDVADLPELHDLVTSSGAAHLVSLTPDGLVGSVVPLLLDRERGPFGTLVGHLARANHHWRDVSPGVESMAIFAGPDAYISPSWYATKRETAKVVPTWNYVAVHAYGELVVHDDPVWLEDLVRRLTDHHEASRDEPWSAPTAILRRRAGGRLPASDRRAGRAYARRHGAGARRRPARGLHEHPGGRPPPLARRRRRAGRARRRGPPDLPRGRVLPARRPRRAGRVPRPLLRPAAVVLRPPRGRQGRASTRSAPATSAAGSASAPSSPTTAPTTASSSTCRPRTRRTRPTPSPPYLRLDGPNQWLPDDVLPGFHRAVDELFTRLGAVAVRADGGPVGRPRPRARPPARRLRRAAAVAGQADQLPADARR